MSQDLITQWWLATLGDRLIWARLRELEEGQFELLSTNGYTTFPDEDSARAALLDAEYRALDGFDEDDALALGSTLDDLIPPEGDDDEIAESLVQLIEKPR